MEIEVSKKELRLLSYDLRVVASRLIRTDYREGIANLQRFLNFLNASPLLMDFILKNQVKEYDIEEAINTRGYYETYKVPEIPEEEISFTYQLLNYTLKNLEDYDQLARGYISGGKIQHSVDEFNRSVVAPFVQHLNSYIERLMIEMGMDEKSSVQINITGGNVGQFNFGQGNSTINASNIVNNNDIEKFNCLVEKFLQYIEKEDLTGDDKETVTDLINVVKEDINSGKPKKGILKTCQEKLNSIFVKVKEGTEFAKTVKDIISYINLIIQMFNAGK